MAPECVLAQAPATTPCAAADMQLRTKQTPAPASNPTPNQRTQVSLVPSLCAARLFPFPGPEHTHTVACRRNRDFIAVQTVNSSKAHKQFSWPVTHGLQCLLPVNTHAPNRLNPQIQQGRHQQRSCPLIMITATVDVDAAETAKAHNTPTPCCVHMSPHDP